MTWENLLETAGRDPINLDISNYSDDWCAGFLAGQVSILEEIRAERLVLPSLRILEFTRASVTDSVLGLCPHGVDLDREFCPEGCRV